MGTSTPPPGPDDGLVEARRLALTGRLAADACHDLNNLLGKIIGLAELTMDEIADRPGACAELETLISVAEAGALVVARLEASSPRTIAAPRRFDLVALLGTACAAAQARRPELAIDRETPAGPLWMLADDTLLRVAFDVVLDNAAQSGARRVTVSCRAPDGSAGDRQVEVVVRDDGAGMASEALARACEAVFTTRASEGAAGLGLSLARTALSECGGRIEIDSSPGGGTTVRLTFPEIL